MARFYRSFIGRTVLAALLMHSLLALFLAAGIYRIIAGDLKDEFVNSVRSQSRQFALSLDGQPSADVDQGDDAGLAAERAARRRRSRDGERWRHLGPRRIAATSGGIRRGFPLRSACHGCVLDRGSGQAGRCRRFAASCSSGSTSAR